MRITLVLLALFLLTTIAAAQPRVATGADLLVARHLDLLKGKRVGMIINHTSRLSAGGYLVDTLVKAGVNVTALFGPEHGVRGAAAAGEKVTDSVDPQTGVRVFSLYGENNKPTAEMLQNVDLLIYDIQDVGARFYTYITTLMLCMDAAAEHAIPFIVLDRPDPLGALVDGPILEDSLRSFVGLGPVPVVYGMTCGELAMFMNGSGWLTAGRKADLTVIWMAGWKRNMDWQATGLPWVAPSPNIPAPEHALAFPAGCFVEATNLSEGRGTSNPFVLLGAPFLNGEEFAQGLNRRGLSGVRFTPATFTPSTSKQAGRLCHGVAMQIFDPFKFRPVLTGLTLISELLRERPDSVVLNRRWLGKLLGKGVASRFLEIGGEPIVLVKSWEAETEAFALKIGAFRHYPPE
jgi:uncharacterized protein YbbC (DUF1343 family)